MSLEDDYLQLLQEHGLPLPKPGKDPLDHAKLLASDPRPASSWLQRIARLNLQFDPDGKVVKRETEMFAREKGFLWSVLASRGESPPQNLYFNFFPTDDVNASASPTKNGYLCLLNSGLHNLLSNMACELAYASAPASRGFRFPDPNTLRQNAVLQSVVGHTVALIARYLEWKTHDEIVYTTPIEIGNELLALHMYGSMCKFVLCHEVGHALLGHLQSAIVRNLLVDGRELRVLCLDHEQEYAADTWAQTVLCDWDMDEHDVFPVSVGGPLFLQIALLVELVKAKLRGEEFDMHASTETHPAIPSRCDRIFEFVNRNLDGTERRRCATLGEGAGNMVAILWGATITQRKEGVEIYIPRDNITIAAEYQQE